MARKKRLQEVKEIPEVKPSEPVSYQDAFQAKANKQIKEISEKIEGKGRTILYALAAFLVLVVLIGLIYSWNRRSGGAGQAALGRAIETSLAPVTTQPIPPTYTGKAFKSEKERSEAAVAEFQKVADSFGGGIGEKAKYFVAVTKLGLDRNAAIGELEGLAKLGGEVGPLAKFALAQAKEGDKKFDEAAALYQDLANSNDGVISKDTINLALANIFDKQGKKAEAIELFFKIADEASKAKDTDGKSIPMSQTAVEAKEKLQSLDPVKAAEIKVETTQLPG